MERVERVVPERQPLLRLQRRRQRVGKGGCERERRLDQLAELLRRDLLARRVDGREVRGRVRLLAEVVALDREPVAGRLAAQPHVGARLEPLREPALVEPRRLDRAGAVGDDGLEDREPSPGPPERGRAHRALDRHLLVAEEIGDPPVPDGLLVPERPVREEVADGLEPELQQPPADRDADSGERVERGVEELRPGPGAWRRPGRGLVQGCRIPSAGGSLSWFRAGPAEYRSPVRTDPHGAASGR